MEAKPERLPERLPFARLGDTPSEPKESSAQSSSYLMSFSLSAREIRVSWLFCRDSFEPCRCSWAATHSRLSVSESHCCGQLVAPTPGASMERERGGLGGRPLPAPWLGWLPKERGSVEAAPRAPRRWGLWGERPPHSEKFAVAERFTLSG